MTPLTHNPELGSTTILKKGSLSEKREREKKGERERHLLHACMAPTLFGRSEEKHINEAKYLTGCSNPSNPCFPDIHHHLHNGQLFKTIGLLLKTLTPV